MRKAHTICAATQCARRGSTQTKHSLVTVLVLLIVVWVTVPFYPFLLALSATDETTEATRQTNTPAHRPEDNFPFPAAQGPSPDFPDDLYRSRQLHK